MTTLVLLPGMDGTGLLFEPLVNFLKCESHSIVDLHVVAYPNSGDQSYEALAEYTLSLLPKNERLILLGESFSGPIAILLAEKLGERVLATILCCTFAQSPHPFTHFLRPLVTFVPFELRPHSLVNYLLLGSFQTPALCKMLHQSLDQVPAKTLRLRLKSVMSIDVLGFIREIKCPIFYIEANQDRLISPASRKLIALNCENISVEKLDGPHCLLQTRPEESGKLIQRIIQQVLN